MKCKPLSEEELQKLQNLKRNIIPSIEKKLYSLYNERDELTEKQESHEETVKTQKEEKELKKRRKIYQMMEGWVKQNKPHVYAKNQKRLRKAEIRAKEIDESCCCFHGGYVCGSAHQNARGYLRNAEIEAMTRIIRTYIEG